MGAKGSKNEVHSEPHLPSDFAWTVMTPTEGIILSVGGQKNENNYIRFVCISDTHGGHLQMKIPDGDVLIVSGDFTRWKSSEQDLKEFNTFLGTLSHKHKVVIAGNHELSLEPNNIENTKALLSNCTHYLEDTFVILEGIKIYGTPWHIQRESLLKRANAFGLDKLSIHSKWNDIPLDTDILITHFPPHGYPHTHPDSGCPYLLGTVAKVKPKVHIFGHDHRCYGIYEGQTCIKEIDEFGVTKSKPSDDPKIIFINAANTTENKGMRQPIVFDYVNEK